jgi:hypothetical protein
MALFIFDLALMFLPLLFITWLASVLESIYLRICKFCN